MKILEVLKKKNRTLLEMNLGIIAFGLLLQIVAIIAVNALPDMSSNQGEKALIELPRLLNWCISLFLGTMLSLAAVQHMYRTLDVALDLDEGTAQKMIYKGYIIRYLVLVAVILFLIGTRLLNPLLVFLSYMSLKVTVYLQPFTHKLCNKIFHETDPIPEPEEAPEEPATDVEGGKAGSEE